MPIEEVAHGLHVFLETDPIMQELEEHIEMMELDRGRVSWEFYLLQAFAVDFALAMYYDENREVGSDIRDMFLSILVSLVKERGGTVNLIEGRMETYTEAVKRGGNPIQNVGFALAKCVGNKDPILAVNGGLAFASITGSVTEALKKIKVTY